MVVQPDIAYRALRARDRRFDGLFFVGVTTTGIYCRPICTARLPGRDRCVFFPRAVDAERGGYRACFRCRPELAPGNAPSDSISRLVRTAVSRVEAGCLNEGSLDDLSRELGVSGRHLRRAMEAELGTSPVELAQSRRLALAKQLLQDTSLPVTDVAFSSGFSSVRRFNALFSQRFGQTPSSLRRGRPARSHEALTLRLDYRPPFDWAGVLVFLNARATPGVESVEGGAYRRTARLGDRVGWISVRTDVARHRLEADVSLSLAPVLMTVVARLRGLFDLDAHPQAIAEHLGRDPQLSALVRRRPGLRVAGAFDGFETAVRAILGQQVSVRGATTLMGRFVARFGSPLATPVDGLTHVSPSADAVAALTEREVASIGIPGARARTLLSLARAVADGTLRLGRGEDPAAMAERLLELPGIGPWTAQYVAMRALGWPDAFPGSDLGIRKALGGRSPAAIEEMSQAWRPWRAYAAGHLWASLADGVAR
jgi:AraC family transcriptional regulator of adaptative response / DNA-3-methyladenine glycosylase II